MRRDDADSTRAAPRLLLLAAVIAAVAGTSARVEEERNPPHLEDRVTWRSPEEAFRVGATSHRPVLLFFSDGMATSDRLEREIFGERLGAPRLNRKFVMTRIVDPRPAGGRISERDADLMKRFGVSELPALVAVQLGHDARVFSRYPGRERAIQFLAAVP